MLHIALRAIRPWVEPGQQPAIEVFPRTTPAADPGRGERRRPLGGDVVELGFHFERARHTAARVQSTIQYRPHTPHLATPDGAGQSRVFEQTARPADADAMGLQQREVVTRVGTRARSRRRVGLDLAQQVRQAWLVLDVELEDPGRVVEFWDRLGDRGLNRIAQLPHETRCACLGAGGCQLEQRADAHAVLEQETTAIGQVLDPRQEVGKRWRSGVQRLHIGRRDGARLGRGCR